MVQIYWRFLKILLLLLVSEVTIASNKWLVILSIPRDGTFFETVSRIEATIEHLQQGKKVEVIYEAKISDIIKNISRSDLEAIFFVGHGSALLKNGLSVTGGRILDIDGVDISGIWGSVHHNLKWLGMISCSTRSIFEAQQRSKIGNLETASLISTGKRQLRGFHQPFWDLMNLKRLKNVSNLVIDSPPNLVEGEVNFLKSTRAALKYVQQLEQKPSSCKKIRTKSLRIWFQRKASIPGQILDPAIVRMNGVDQVYLEGSHVSQTWQMIIPVLNEDFLNKIKISIRSIKPNATNLGESVGFSYQQSEVTEFFRTQLSSEGKPLGVGLHVMKPAHHNLRLLDASNFELRTETVCHP